MSKMDNLRAMREARYEQAKAQAAGAAPRPARPRPVAATAAPATSAPEASPEPTDDALCGHRNMGGRTCTREKGHAAKSHRYS